MAKKPEVFAPALYHWLLDARAPTLSGSSAIQYAVLADPDHRHLHLLITAAEGGGNFNREVVSLDALEAAIDAAPAGKPFVSKQLRAAFLGKSNNNAPYACAALLDQGLLAKSPAAKFGLVKAGDWAAWRREKLAMEGEPYLFPPLPAAVPSVEAPATPDTGKRKKKDRRGGNRFIPVSAAEGVEGVEDVELDEIDETMTAGGIADVDLA